MNTKFNIGEIVFFLSEYGLQISSGEIYKIELREGVTTLYTIKDLGYVFNEGEISSSPEECVYLAKKILEGSLEAIKKSSS